MSDTQRKVIKCRAAICWEPNKPMTIEQIDVDPPKAGEVRIKVIANSICHSDIHVYAGFFQNNAVRTEFPCILGHEATGIVESVGEGVTTVKVGDHIITLFTPMCRECAYCKNPKTNLCLKRKFDETRMIDQTTRYSFNGKPVYHFAGISGLSEYAVITEFQVAKINPNAKMDKVCIFACGFATGYGGAVNVARIDKGSTVAVWGLGGVGLAAVYGAKVSGASNIIGVDVNENKFEIAKKIGCNNFVNPLRCQSENKTAADVIKSMTDGNGVDFALDCIGCAADEAFASLSPWGTLVQIGIASPEKKLQISPNEFLSGKKITGTLFGGYKSRDEIPNLIEDYVNGKMDLEPFFTGSIKLEDVNDAFQWLIKGDALRTVVLL